MNFVGLNLPSSTSLTLLLRPHLQALGTKLDAGCPLLSALRTSDKRWDLWLCVVKARADGTWGKVRATPEEADPCLANARGLGVEKRRLKLTLWFEITQL